MPIAPKQAADDCLVRAELVLALSQAATTPAGTRDDLLRFGVLLSIASIDTYLHWLVVRRISSVRRREKLPKNLAKLEIPFENLAQLADNAIDAQQRNVRGRPWVSVKGFAQKKLLSDTFQSYEQVAKALSMCGITKGWSKIADELGVTSPIIKAKLNALVHRRNQIAHEGDIARQSRPQNIYHNEVTYASVNSDLVWVRGLLDAMQAVVDRE